MKPEKVLIKMIFGATLLLSTICIVSCKKTTTDGTTGGRDKFVGTWTGNLYFSRIGQEFSTTEIITKSTTNSAQIVFTRQGSSSTPRIATVNGNSYIYLNFSASVGVSGNYTGVGSINGTELTESGLITSDGSPYQGNLGEWGRRLIKQ